MTQPAITQPDGATVGDRLWSALLRATARGRTAVRARSALVALVAAPARRPDDADPLPRRAARPGAFLLGRVTAGLLDAKERSALDEARAGLAQAQLLADAADSSDPLTKVALVDGIARQLANRAGNPSIYEVLLLELARQPAAATPRSSGPTR